MSMTSPHEIANFGPFLQSISDAIRWEGQGFRLPLCSTRLRSAMTPRLVPSHGL